MTVLRYQSPLTGSQVWEGDAREVAASMAAGSCSLAILDGPYGMQKAQWDRMNVAELPEWYRPHLEDVGRICAPSASLYFWNTSAGWAAVHPVILSMGWTFRALVVWDKTVAHMAGRVDTNGLRTWFDVSEVCGFYQREEWAPSTCAGSEIAYAAGADDRNWVRPWLCEEWKRAGLKRSEADKAMGTNGMAGHYFGKSQWSLPTWDAYKTLARYAAQHGAPSNRPYLVHPDFWQDGGLRATYDHLRAEYEHLRAEYEHLRAEYEASRPAFDCPMGVGNVWTHPPVAGGERLRTESGAALHPCQKPVLFAERMIRASTRAGDTVWAPFGGTLREAVAAENIARANKTEARRVITSELNADGVDYIGPGIQQMKGGGTRRLNPKQVSMW